MPRRVQREDHGRRSAFRFRAGVDYPVRGRGGADPYRRRDHRYRRSEPGRPQPWGAWDCRPRPRAAGRPGPGPHRAPLCRNSARNVLVDRAGHHERDRRHRHGALGYQGKTARALRSTTCWGERRGKRCGCTGISTTDRRRSDRSRDRGSGRRCACMGGKGFQGASLFAGGGRSRRSRGIPTRSMLASVRAAERLRLELGNEVELLFDATRCSVRSKRSSLPTCSSPTGSSFTKIRYERSMDSRCDSCDRRRTCRSRPASNSVTSGSSNRSSKKS